MSPELINLLQSAGVGVIPLLGYMWWSERTRANDERNKNELLAREIITSTITTNVTLANLEKLFSSVQKSSSGGP